jgi:PilZ domain
MSALQLRRNEEVAREASVQLPKNTDLSFQNRRGAPREPARDLCEILTDGLRYAMSCMAHNISATGALLETSLTGVPDRFILVNHAKHTRTVCQVVWRCGRMVGVRFTRPPRSFS